MLAGEGGIGKSSIAYEFADHVTLLPDDGFTQIVWLSAKEKQFRPFRDSYEDMPETHFSNYDELLNALCDHLAITEDERTGISPVKKLRLIKNALQTIPSLIIIDDIDSLDQAEQRQAVEIGLLLGGTKSKLLLTTRKNISYSSDVCYETRGLKLEEFGDFFDALSDRFSVGTRRDLKASDVRLIWDASHGSPLYAESIFRLLSFQTVGEAVKRWKNESGDAVRRAALHREIGQLLPEAKRILLALARLGEASPIELAEVAGYSREKVNEALTSISSLFLIDAPRLGPEDRTRLNDTTCRLAISLEDELVPDPARLERKVKEMRQAASGLVKKGNMTVAKAINQACSLEREGCISDALATLNDALRQVGRAKGHDLLAYIAHLHLKGPPKDVNAARDACRQAFRGGVRKKRLFETWFNAEWDAGNYVGAEECAKLALDNHLNPRYEWRIRLAAALASKAHDQAGGRLGLNVLNAYLESSKELACALEECPPIDIATWTSSLEAANDTVWTILRGSVTSAAECYANAKQLVDLMDRGDLRIKNYLRTYP